MRSRRSWSSSPVRRSRSEPRTREARPCAARDLLRRDRRKCLAAVRPASLVPSPGLLVPCDRLCGSVPPGAPRVPRRPAPRPVPGTDDRRTSRIVLLRVGGALFPLPGDRPARVFPVGAARSGGRRGAARRRVLLDRSADAPFRRPDLLSALGVEGDGPDRLDLPGRRLPVPGPVVALAAGPGMRERIRQREQDPWVGARIGLLQWIALGLFLLLLGRLYWMQVVRSEHFRTLSENNRLRLRAIRAPRGVILDRKGRSIAETAASFDLICFPGDVPDLERELRLLAEVLDFDPAETREQILAAKRKNPFKSITVARDIRFEQVSVIELNREALPGFSILVEAKRSYPFGAQFAHVLGYVGEASEEDLEPGDNGGVSMGDLVGKNGMEKTWGNALRGENGGRYVEVDAAGRDRRLVREVTPRRGDTVQTTLDAEIQKAAYEAMGNRAGAVIAMDPRSGEILALVSTPAYDPNLFSRKLKAEEWQALVRNPRNPMQSKGVQGTFAPGSTVKPLLVLEALESGAQDPRAAVSCNGSFTLGNRSFRCWQEKGHGRVDMYKAVVQSCDVYFYTLGLKLDPDRVAELERRMGLGVQTGIDLPGERK